MNPELISPNPLFFAILDQLNDGIVVYNHQGHLLYASKTAQTFYPALANEHPAIAPEIRSVIESLLDAIVEFPDQCNDLVLTAESSTKSQTSQKQSLHLEGRWYPEVDPYVYMPWLTALISSLCVYPALTPVCMSGWTF